MEFMLAVLVVLGAFASGYLIGNGRARSVIGDLREAKDEAENAYKRVYDELQAVKAKLTRKKA